MKTVKKAFSIFMVLVITLCVVGIETVPVHAATITRSQMKKKVSTTQKQIEKLKRKYNKINAKYKQQTKGKPYILGELISSNPFVVYDSSERTYYWIENRSYVSVNELFGTASGYVELTGEYRTYNNLTCAVANSVKVTTSYSDVIKVKDKLNKKKKVLKEYKDALVDKVEFVEKIIYMNTGRRIYPGYGWKKLWKTSKYYNTIKWKSSNTNIATVDKDGYVTAKKAGTVTISATAGLSKKTTKYKIVIDDPMVEFAQHEIEMRKYEGVFVSYTTNIEKDDIKKINLEYSDENVAIAIEYKDKSGIEIHALGTGVCNITITLNGIVQDTVQVTVLKDENNPYDDDEYWE